MNKKKKIVAFIISYPDMRAKKEIESLVQLGFDVFLIIWERGWPFNLHCPVYKTAKLKVNYHPKRIYGYLFCLALWWLFVLYHLLTTKFDIIHSVNIDSYTIGLIVSKIKRVPIIYDVYDFFADTEICPLFRKYLSKVVGRFDRFIMKYSDSIIIVDESRIKQLGKINPQKVTTMYNSPPKKLLDKFDTNIKKDNNNCFTIFLGGGIWPDRATDFIIKTVKNIKNIKLVIKGICLDKSYKQTLINLAGDSSNIIVNLNGVDYSEIIKSTIEADLLIALYNPAIPNNIYASPNKLFEAMMCNKPILVTENTSMANIVNECKCGISIPYDDSKTLKETIEMLKSNPEFCAEMGSNGRKAFEQKYHWGIMEEKLKDLYDKLLNKNC